MFFSMRSIILAVVVGATAAASLQHRFASSSENGIRDRSMTEQDDLQSYAQSIRDIYELWKTRKIDLAKPKLTLVTQGRKGWEWLYLHRLVMCHEDNSSNRHFECTILTSRNGRFRSARFNPAASDIISAQRDGIIHWNVATGVSSEVLLSNVPATWADYSPDGRRVVYSFGGSAEIRDAVTHEHLVDLDCEPGIVSHLLFSSSSKEVVGANGNVVKLWNGISGAATLTLKGHSDQVMCVAIDQRNKYIGSSGADHIAIIWEAASGKKMHVLKGHSDLVRTIMFSSDSRWAVTASSDKNARIWDVASGHMVRELKGHSSEVTCASFNKDGSRVATGATDGSIKIWDVTSGVDLLTLTRHSGSVTSISFSRDDMDLLSAGVSEVIHWSARVGRQTSPMPRKVSGRNDLPGLKR